VLRVAIVTETYHPVVGGGETQARALARGLTRLGATAMVITRRSSDELAEAEIVDGVPVYRLGPTGRNHLNKWGLLFSAFPALLRHAHSYDVIFVSGFRILGLPAILAGKLLGRPVFLKADSVGEMSGEFFAAGLRKIGLSLSSFPFRLFLALRDFVLRRGERFVAISTPLREELIQGGIAAEKIRSIPNSVDTDRFCPVDAATRQRLRHELGLPEQRDIAVFTGRLVGYKGLPGLLRVWKKIVASRSDVLLLLVGDGGMDIHDCETSLRSFVAEHELESHVRFAGSVDDVERYLQAADLFVFPTENEAFGISLIEAMSCALPAVTTAAGGVVDVATDDHDALCIPAGDDEALQAGLERLLSDRALGRRLGAAARATARRRFSEQGVVGEFAGLFAGTEEQVDEDEPEPRRLDDPLLRDLTERPRPIIEDISVVIPTLGREILESSLAWIACGEAWPAEVIVVDQGTNETAATLLARLARVGLRTRHIRSSRRGRSVGLNLGFAALTTRFVAVTDDDCFVAPDWLSIMRQRLEDATLSIVSGRVEAAGWDDNVAVVTDRRPAVYRRPRLSFDAMSGGNMGTSREVLERVGPFDEHATVQLSEDGEWCYRALRAGVAVIYAPELLLWHYGWRGAAERGEQYRAYARSHGGFYGKYLRQGDLFIALRAAIHLLRAARRWLFGLLRGKPDQARRGRAYLFGLPRGILAGMRRKRDA